MNFFKLIMNFVQTSNEVLTNFLQTLFGQAEVKNLTNIFETHKVFARGKNAPAYYAKT
jgi:hypothetical protein